MGSEMCIRDRGAVPAAVDVRRRVLVEMRCKDGFTIGGTGEPGKAGADAVGPVVSTESVPCVGLLEGVDWATTVAAVGASAEPAPTSVGTAKTEAKSLSAVGKAPPPGRGSDRRWRRMQKHERRISPTEQKGRQSSYVARVCESRNNRRR